MNLDDFSTVVDDRRYINPQVALDESNAFIQNLRDTQQTRNAEISRDTHNLGTDVTSNLGGLSGSDSYFNARYQTPQTNTLIADLKATAQAQALTDAMNNALSQAKQRYSKAYKNYQKRHNNTTTPTTTNPSNNGKLPIDTDTPSSEGYVDTGGTDPDTFQGKKITGIDAGDYMQNKGTFDVMQPENGYSYTRNGKTYIFISDGTRPTGWYKVVGGN